MYRKLIYLFSLVLVFSLATGLVKRDFEWLRFEGDFDIIVELEGLVA